MAIFNKFAILLAEKQVAERRRVPLSEVAQATGVAWRTLQAWANNSVTRFDADILDALCKYFGVQPGDLLYYVHDVDLLDYDDTPREVRNGIDDDLTIVE